MAWLTLWLKKIILLVLLAAFLDLILPNTTLQRYVKMVMGLILLLTIISPVFALFSLSQDDLALRLDRYQQELNKPASVEWKKMTDKLMGQQNEQITAYVQAQVASAVKARVKADYGMEVADVTVVVDQKRGGADLVSHGAFDSRSGQQSRRERIAAGSADYPHQARRSGRDHDWRRAKARTGNRRYGPRGKCADEPDGKRSGRAMGTFQRAGHHQRRVEGKRKTVMALATQAR
ncbi:stage III sporulation protein AF [Brevibacillus gelatini]